MPSYRVKTPSRICLLGEHQDYLGLEVIASAIDLFLSAEGSPRGDHQIVVRIRDKSISELGARNTDGLYETVTVDLDAPIVYENRRDYFKSAVTVLRRAGVEVRGCDLKMDSEIPIGKGMCSSTTMVLAYVTALAAVSGSPLAQDPAEMARLAWEAEVAEFGEPGGMMDHYASAYGGLSHIDFSDGVRAQRLDVELGGTFVLIDSLQQKDTIRVLSDSKYPTLEGLEQLKPYGISSIRDFYDDRTALRFLDRLDQRRRQRVEANIENYALLREALELFRSGSVDDERLGALLNAHQRALRDGLGISTPTIDGLLALAMEHGAYGGKFNGSGGGGCLYVYAARERADGIIRAVRKAGYPAVVLSQAKGLTVRAV